MLADNPARPTLQHVEPDLNLINRVAAA